MWFVVTESSLSSYLFVYPFEAEKLARTKFSETYVAKVIYDGKNEIDFGGLNGLTERTTIRLLFVDWYDKNVKTKKIEKITNDLKSNILCCICMENPKEIAFIPCGHRACCMKCSNDVIKSNNKICPLCKTNIDSVLKVYV